ncbi:DUF4118 domain-containing protein [Polynucleobacter asymbioticus]|jgi:K+-sensing histidine kinase KdpD|uniref:Sensor protein KdpD transmembrane domain-containing protein n=1 Tax=Polynucleobacter asymbioticus TaxID=576611 RepID=A0AAC9IPM0_9BURK|nr:DUF4118 domain-containing protein [Polynucleobacter asymbioticus]APB98183.1 hypothetical protein A4F89_01950 [Polynucleobacter asymbioticus]APC00469.1 hypothetical protein AOC25_01955 [Polynucleobacter asymbioticus]
MSATKIGQFSKLYFAKVQVSFFILCSILLTFSLRLKLSPILADKLPLVFFIINSLIITHLFGLAAGFSALISGAVLSYYFFVPPYESWALPDSYHLIYFCFKFLIGSLLVLMTIWIKDQLRELWDHH